MKQFLLSFLLISTYFIASSQVVSDFEGLVTDSESVRDGSDGSAGFSNAGGFFPTLYNFDYFYWQSGWAISNITDSITSGYTNLYAAKPAMGNDSPTYAVGQQNSIIEILPDLSDVPVSGVYITNSTYAYNSMRDGDGFAKKFGGDTGDDPDFFKLLIQGYKDGQLTSDSVEFYLADYRFENNEEDYIVDTWQWVELSSLGPVDSLLFILSSSDVGGYGINTPTFFCIDDMTIDLVSVEEENLSDISVKAFPNPATNYVQIDVENFSSESIIIQLFNSNGKRVYTTKELNTPTVQLGLTQLPVGFYILHVIAENKLAKHRIIKQ